MPRWVAQAIEWLVGEVLPESTNLALVSWGPRGMKGGTEFRTCPPSEAELPAPLTQSQPVEVNGFRLNEC